MKAWQDLRHRVAHMDLKGYARPILGLAYWLPMRSIQVLVRFALWRGAMWRMEETRAAKVPLETALAGGGERVV